METRIESIFTSKSKSAFLNSILEKSVPEVPHMSITLRGLWGTMGYLRYTFLRNAI